MLRTGVDIVEISRIGAAVARWGDRFFNRIYTPGELSYSRGRLPQLAGRFAAKEAVMKALGTGVRGGRLARDRSGAQARPGADYRAARPRQSPRRAPAAGRNRPVHFPFP